MEGFNCQSCGACCGPVAITNKEFKQLKRAAKAMGKTKREKLQKQHRSPLTCIFLDQETKRCGVYHARPDICRMFGLYEGLQCPNNTHIELLPDHEGRRRVRKNHTSPIKGILTTDITWEDFK